MVHARFSRLDSHGCSTSSTLPTVLLEVDEDTIEVLLILHCLLVDNSFNIRSIVLRQTTVDQE